MLAQSLSRLHSPVAKGASIRAKRGRIFAAFTVVYLVWGSTYFAIKIAVATLPPLSMAGARFLIAGAILTAIGPRRRASGRAWLRAGLMGALFFLAGNGGITWASAQGLPSGLSAVVVATVPLWIFLLGPLLGVRQARPLLAWIGIGLGLGGVSLLFLVPEAFAATNFVLLVVVLGGALAWASGSLITSGTPAADRNTPSSGMNMLAGGAWLMLAGALSRDLVGFDLSAVSLASWLAFAYLILFGSVLGFSSYSFLLKHADPGRVATYAYVNPLVAVVLGVLVLNEPLTLRVILAMSLILSAVILIRRPARSTARALTYTIARTDSRAD